MRDIVARFWSNVDVRGDDDCWEWKLSRVPKGYGSFWLRSNELAIAKKYGVISKFVIAHRFAYEHPISGHEKKIPDGLHVLHRCDNPPCCNYKKHLFLGTRSDNMLDMYAKKRHPHCGGIIENSVHIGATNGNAKLTENDVIEIRALYDTGNYSFSVLGKMYQISYPHVKRIVTLKSWKHLG